MSIYSESYVCAVCEDPNTDLYGQKVILKLCDEGRDKKHSFWTFYIYSYMLLWDIGYILNIHFV